MIERRPFQFSLRAVFGLATLVAILLAWQAGLRRAEESRRAEAARELQRIAEQFRAHNQR
jgi:hypothetical protein